MYYNIRMEDATKEAISCEIIDLFSCTCVQLTGKSIKYTVYLEVT